MTMFFERSLTCGRRSWLLSVEAVHFVRAPLSLQAAGVAHAVTKVIRRFAKWFGQTTTPGSLG